VNKKEKERIVKSLEEKFGKCASSVFTEFRGINVKRLEQLRKRSRENNIEFKVLKNTLAKRAYGSLNLEGMGLDLFFEGPTAVAFGWDDPITPIKILSEFAKENPELVLKGGVIEGKTITKQRLASLATLPPKDVLLSQVLMRVQSPISSFMNILNSPILGFFNCLKAIEGKKS